MTNDNNDSPKKPQLGDIAGPQANDSTSSHLTAIDLLMQDGFEGELDDDVASKLAARLSYLSNEENQVKAGYVPGLIVPSESRIRREFEFLNVLKRQIQTIEDAKANPRGAYSLYEEGLLPYDIRDWVRRELQSPTSEFRRAVMQMELDTVQCPLPEAVDVYHAYLRGELSDEQRRRVEEILQDPRSHLARVREIDAKDDDELLDEVQRRKPRLYGRR